MAPKVDPVHSDDALPAETEVVVIGGGIIGISAAFMLAERGVPVVLCEKGHIAGEQSSRNWGWCRQMGRDPRELPLAMEALKTWSGLNRRIGAETGFRKSGTLYMCGSEAELAKREAWLDHARPFQLDSRLVSQTEIETLLPGSAGKFIAGLHTPGDGRAEPQMAAPAIARAARGLGAKILAPCAVRGIETEGGRVARVVTETGAVRCRSVILAGGAWSRSFLRNLGLDLPQLTTRGSVFRTGPVKSDVQVSALGAGVAFRRRLDGGFNVANGVVTVAEIVPDSFRFLPDFMPLLSMEWRAIRLRLSQYFFDQLREDKSWALDRQSPFERTRVLDPAPMPKVLERAKANLVKLFPEFAGVAMAESWAGFIDVTPDAVPVISHVDTLPGLVVATGFSGHGFGIGPGAGRLAADLATGAPPVVDPAPYRFSRFSDGSRPKPLSGI